MEEAFKQERETKEAVKQVCQLCSFHSLSDTLDAFDDETDENRLLPAMNKIWPFLVACIRNKNPLVSVLRLPFFASYITSMDRHYFHILLLTLLLYTAIKGLSSQVC